ncbi:recombinase RecT [Brachybacterium subflavum]|uniref:recombinase RecT n=1 Tax=Brachybacterium subflavum TaxID=2585206 RepID=UPI0012665A89|nr:recombinase RecT [Brachybacterium subflavum]
MSEVVVHQPQQALDLEQQMNYSKALAAASIIPKDYRNSPANILVAIGYAQALGEAPIAALTDVYVVNGRPSMSASMMHRRALEAGHRVRVVADDQQATASIWRRDDPQYEHKVTWTMDAAQKAGLTKNPTWKSFPAAMLRSRAISEACRLACPEVLGPAKYTPDEIGGTFADAPEGAPAAAPQSTTKVSRRKREEPKQEPEPTPAADTHGQDDLRAAIAGTGEVITADQMKKLCVLLGENDIDEKNYEAMSRVIGREISSKKDLSKDEASRLIDSLETRMQNRSN